MIAAWMVYALVVSAILTVAGALTERALRGSGRPVRWAWTGQILAAVTIPLWAFLPGATTAEAGNLEADPTPILLEPFQVTVGESSLFHLLDRPLLLGWAVLSTLLVLRIMVGARRLLRMRGGWEQDHLDGSPVLVSSDVGPAVAGVLRPEIVVPTWLREMPGRDLVVAHEREHLRARDGQLLAATSLLVALVPWNPLLWWSHWRLRLATELDCDDRVLRIFPGRVREYCELLLSVGQSPGTPIGAPALSEPPTLLERRIDVMTRKQSPVSRTRTVALAALVSMSLGAACFYPSPDGTESAGPLAVALEATDLDAEITAGPMFTPFTVRPDLQNMEEVRRALEENYPPLLRDAGIGGTVNIWFLIDPRGTVRETRVQKTSGHPALDQGALRVAETMRFSPAMNRDEPVPVWVAFPITFTTN